MPWAESISVANHSTILKMLPKDKMYDILSQPSEERVITMVIDFLDSNAPRDEFYPLRLGQIATAVEYITQVKYNGTGFNKDAFGDSQEYAKENWLIYLAKHRPDMSPLYDGIAWVVMQQGHLPSVEESKEILHKSWST